MRAHDEAVRATLEWIEETLLETRGWDPATRRRPRMKSPSMVAALFRHIASRNGDPQLHTHAVVANMTRGADGQWKSVEPTLLHRNARLIGAYYRNELARRLTAKGYSIVPAMAGRIPSFEIAGYGKKLCDAFSSRRREIVAWVDERGLDRTSRSMQKGNYATRNRKAEPVRAILQQRWAERARELGPRPLAFGVAAARGGGGGRGAPGDRDRRPRDGASRGAPAGVSGATSWRRRRSPIPRGRTRSSGAGRGGVDGARRPSGGGGAAGFGPVVRDRTHAEGRAQGNRGDEGGIGKTWRLAGEHRVEAHLAGAGLTPGQCDAVRTILLAEDRIVGVQGRAGTGKTTMLRHVRELAGGRPVIGLAPSAAAARVLERETDIHARTLQWFLTRCRALDATGPLYEKLKATFGGSVLVLDEASMVSTDQMLRLMQVAERLGVARLVLVGDRSQLRAVEAGQPFRQLQDAGMATARMDDILRQKNPELKKAVLSVLEGDPAEAMEMLGAGVHEVDHEDLGVRAAEAWLALDPETRDGDTAAGADACAAGGDQPDGAGRAGGGGGAERPDAPHRAAGQSRHDPGREGRRAQLPGGRHGGLPAGPGQLPGEEGRGSHGERDRARHGGARPPGRQAAPDSARRAGCATGWRSTRPARSSSARATGSAGPATTTRGI